MNASQFLQPLLGGLLIGSGAALLLLWNGQIAGVSGILDRTLHGALGQDAWRLYFLAGLALPTLLPALHSKVVLHGSLVSMAAAGFLVGLGTRLANGCTSGHGICGIAAGSRRSFIATLVFMGTAMCTVYVIRYASTL